MNRKGILTMALLTGMAGGAFGGSARFYIGTMTRGGSASKGIYRSALDLETGALAEPALAAETASPSFLALHPNQKSLYAVDSGNPDGGLGAFAIDAETGDLQLINQQSTGGGGPCHVSIDDTGRYGFVANYGSGSAAAFPILPDGGLGERFAFFQHEGSGPNPQRQQGPHAHCATLSPDNRYVYVADLGLDKIMIYRFDAQAGTLAGNDPPFARTHPGAGPRHLAFHPNGKHAYVINEIDSTVTAFACDGGSGALTEIQSVSALPEGFAGASTASEIWIHPNGKFLYGSNRGHDSIAVFRIDADSGRLSFIEFATEDIHTPRHFALDPTGAFCLVANQSDNSIVVFRVDGETGTLKATGNKIAVPAPVCVVFLGAKGS